MIDFTPYNITPKAHISNPILTVENPRPAFCDEMRAYGFDVPPIPSVGRIERVAVADDKAGKKSGWYIYNEVEDEFRPGGVIGIGVFGSWKGNPEKVVWTSKRRETMSNVEQIRMEEQIKAAQVARELEIAARHTRAASDAASIWAEAPPAPETHPYLVAKGVKPHDVRVSRGNIVVPVMDGDVITSLQFIAPEGGKIFLPGGRVKGCSYVIGEPTGVIYVTEGFATGATLHELTGDMVVVAYNAGNLLEATSNIKDRYPDAEIIVAGDDDHATPGNPGREKAQATADVLRVRAIFPDVSGDDTDFNDMAHTQGHEAVREYLQARPRVYERKVEYDAMPEELLNPPGILGDMVAFYNATARARQPGFAVQTALAIGSIICSRNYQTTKNNFSSLYFLNVAKSGSGKEHIKTVIDEVLTAAGMEDLMNGSGYTSAGAVFSTLLRKPRHLTIIDEFGRYLEAAANNKNTNLLEANTQLMEAIGRCHGVVRPTAYSTMTLSKGKAVELADRYCMNPAISMVTMTTPSVLFKPAFPK
ncbi:MAG: hypothetical protein HOJ06_01340 [Rhodospirillaceae bacterium]|nr:hypothetical protein [Rhodospirillaceae bacterium]